MNMLQWTCYIQIMKNKKHFCCCCCWIVIKKEREREINTMIFCTTRLKVFFLYNSLFNTHIKTNSLLTKSSTCIYLMLLCWMLLYLFQCIHYMYSYLYIHILCIFLSHLYFLIKNFSFLRSDMTKAFKRIESESLFFNFIKF